MKIRKIICLIFSLLLISAGWLGYSYSEFQKEFNDKISEENWSSAENAINTWEKNSASWLLKNIPYFKQKLSCEKGWLLAQNGAHEEAIKELKKATGISSHFKETAMYNAATMELNGYLSGNSRESLEKIAEDYKNVLGENPGDFQAKVNLEIVCILQQQEKKKMQAQAGDDENSKKGKEKGTMKKFQPGDREGQGTSSGNQGIRY